MLAFGTPAGLSNLSPEPRLESFRPFIADQMPNRIADADIALLPELRYYQCPKRPVCQLDVSDLRLRRFNDSSTGLTACGLAIRASHNQQLETT